MSYSTFYYTDFFQIYGVDFYESIGITKYSVAGYPFINFVGAKVCPLMFILCKINFRDP